MNVRLWRGIASFSLGFRGPGFCGGIFRLSTVTVYNNDIGVRVRINHNDISGVSGVNDVSPLGRAAECLMPRFSLSLNSSSGCACLFLPFPAVIAIQFAFP